MADFVVTHALDNVWCEPAQDRQYIIKPVRLTGSGGVSLYANVLWDSIKVPDEGDHARWHIYQLGQVHPLLVNLPEIRNSWRNLQGVCEARKLHVNLFLDNGIEIPKASAYVRFNQDSNVLLAVKVVPLFGGVEQGSPLNTNTLYARFYTNNYYSSAGWTEGPLAEELPVRVIGQHVRTEEDYDNFRQLAHNTETFFGSTGKAMWFVNGFVVNKPGSYNPTVHQGTYVEFVYDASIKEQFTINVTDLQSFTSTLDAAMAKLLVVRSNGYQLIDFIDDIDFYLVKDLGGINYKGIHIPRLNVSTIRQVTHNAYSINYNHLLSYVAQNPWMNSLSECKLILNIRHSSLERGLVTQKNRIEELYKLPLNQIVGGMVGVDATIPEWQAATLESSMYCELMRTSAEVISRDDVVDAYGYNTLTKTFAPPIQFPVINVNQRRAVLPPAFNVPFPTDNKARRTIFSYDSNGKFLARLHNEGNYDTIPVGPISGVYPALFEILNNLTYFDDGCIYPVYNSGLNSFTETIVTDHGLKYNGFRCYVCPIVAGVPNEEWYDVTDNVNNYFTYDANAPTPTLTWNAGLLATAHLYPCVKINNKTLWYRVPMNTVAYPGFIKFSVNVTTRFNGVNLTKIQRLAPGSLEVIMDGSPLMENIDYYVNWPEIVVVRRAMQTPMEGLDIRVRCTGFCNPDTMTHYGPRETGFVKGGILSVDDRFQVRNDRNIRIIVGGSLKHREQVRFGEEATGPLVQDGLPFTITDVISPIEHYTNKTVLEFRQESVDLDEVVEDYLSLRLDDEDVLYPAVINNRWDVVSPFCSGMIQALKDGLLDNGELDTAYTNLDVAGWVAPFTYLLDYDPCVLGVNEDYIFIRPHQYTVTVDLTVAQLRFMEYLNTHYLNSKLDFTPFISIGS